MSDNNSPPSKPRFPKGLHRRLEEQVAKRLDQHDWVVSKRKKEILDKIDNWRLGRMGSKSEKVGKELKEVVVASYEQIVRGVLYEHLFKEAQNVEMTSNVPEIVTASYLTPCLVALRDNEQLRNYASLQNWLAQEEQDFYERWMGSIISEARETLLRMGIALRIDPVFKFERFIDAESIRKSDLRLNTKPEIQR